MYPRGEVGDDSVTWISVTHIGGLGWISDFWARHGPAPAAALADFCKMSQWLGDFSLSVFL